MKKLIILGLFIFLTGCSVDYNLEVSNNSFKEKIDIVVAKPEQIEVEYDPENYIEPDDQVTPFVENPTSAFFFNDNDNYKKKVKENGNLYEVSLSYDFSFNEFKEANSLNSCFENIDIKEEDNKYYIRAYGNFYCLYSDEFSIKLKTKNKVIENNAHSVNGDLYVWNINYENRNHVDVDIVIEKGLPLKKILINASILIVVMLGFGFIAYYLIVKNKENNKI